ncbi:hypothetical protein HA402_005335 [Bradysia odoriphaga]|nr:hypothetical protein HA402_005335 [Bradysia odoriphaga]
MTSNFFNKSVEMNDLPDELLIFIFEHLKIQDVIQCSLVCKRFKSVCQGVKIPELIISNTIENIKDYWFDTKAQFNIQNAIDVTTFNSFRSIFRLDKFKRLYFWGCQSEFVQLNLNDLTQLEQVKIDVKDVVGAKHDIYINLPNLKIIEIDRDWSDRSYTFFITAPKLEMLSCYRFNAIHLTYPNTVIHLETKVYTEKFHVLKNLQFLQVVYGFLYEVVWPKIFSIFPKLTTFACSQNGCQTSIKNFLKEKYRLQRNGLKIYYQSVELDHINKIHEYNSLHPEEFVFQIKNYNSLAEIVTCKFEISYNKLMDLLGSKIPSDFYKKYFLTRRIRVENNVENQDSLFRFLKNFQYLTQLNLCCDSLDQFFYNKLVELDQLSDLTIINSKSIFNFDFLLKLKRLHCFSTNIDSPQFFYLTTALFRDLKYFCNMDFHYEKQQFRISKNKIKNYYEILSFGCEKYVLDFNGLVFELNAAAARCQHVNQKTN